MPTHLTADQMKQFVRNYFEDFVTKQNASVTHKNVPTDDYDGSGVNPTDLDDDGHMILGTYKKMPDLRLTIVDMVAKGDKVVCRNIWRWTDASGRKTQFHELVLCHFEGDRIAEPRTTVTSPSEGTAWTAGAKTDGEASG